jgi:putative ABC transport system ATP-binding protein
MIRLQRVSRRFQQGGNEVRALDEVSLEIEAHEFLAVTGESGSGKSTLLHLIGGLDRPDTGEIWVESLGLHSASEAELTLYRRNRLGVVFQFFNLLPTLNVLENVSLPLQLQGGRRNDVEGPAREVLEMVGMAHRANHFIHQLSGGEMQRTAIARALVHRPTVLLADEPTGNLDRQNAERVLEIFEKIAVARITTLLVVTHSQEVAARAQRRIELRGGRLVGAIDREESKR